MHNTNIGRIAVSILAIIYSEMLYDNGMIRVLKYARNVILYYKGPLFAVLHIYKERGRKGSKSK